VSQQDTGGMLPSPGKDATLEELKAAYQQVESSDAPEFLKDRVMMDLADRIRDYGKPAKPEPTDTGEFFIGAPVETVAKSGYKGLMLDHDGRRVKAKPS
jgi:hypothetical protein